MLDLVPGLVSTASMIYGISTYYNTPERMTSLFVKVETAHHFHTFHAKRQSVAFRKILSSSSDSAVVAKLLELAISKFATI